MTKVVKQARDEATSVVIVVEMVHDARIVRLGSKHRTDGVRPYMGDSIGWWEGDTLVVETTHIPAAQQFMGSWKDLKVTERFTRVGKNRLYYGFQVEDPTVWEKPWGGEYEFSPMGNQVLYEYACHEGNYAMEGMRKGARDGALHHVDGHADPATAARLRVALEAASLGGAYAKSQNLDLAGRHRRLPGGGLRRVRRARDRR